MTVLMSMSTSRLTSWYIIRIEHSFYIKWHMYIIIYIGKITLFFMIFFKGIEFTVKNRLPILYYSTFYNLHNP